jgi:hypothetical protein
LTAAQKTALTKAADAELRGEQTPSRLVAADFELAPREPRRAGLTPCSQPGVDPEDWFPLISTEVRPGDDPDGTLARQEADLAERLCAGCPMVDRCLELSLRVGWHGGIWGQMGARDRMTLRAQRKVGRR